MPSPPRRPCVPARTIVSLVLLLVGTGGCQRDWLRQDSTYDPQLPPKTDRLVRTYPDLATKRFQIVADFEEPLQASLFRKLSHGQVEPMSISTERARHETGVGALKMRFDDVTEQVTAADTTRSEWVLHRDWTNYHLLLLSVYSPRQFGGLRISVRSGTDVPLHYRHPRVLLTPGWNLLRIDLGSLADHINLADVRELSFWCEPLNQPIELFLDDLVLVDNKVRVFGPAEAEARPGDLHVHALGRRLVVGATDRFELVFHRGQIMQWFDPTADPARLYNLVGIGTLGPTPVVLPVSPTGRIDPEDPGQWAWMGAIGESVQILAEATPLFVRLESQWRFGNATEPIDDNSPFHRWSYTIYRDGRVFVLWEGSAPTADDAPGGVGVAFRCDADAGFRGDVISPSPADDGSPGDAEPFALFSRDDPGRADLLVIPAAPRAGRMLGDSTSLYRTVIWPLPEATRTLRFAGLLRVWPRDLDTPRQASPVAADYHHPVPLTLDAGRLVPSEEGDFNRDGYDEARGYYALRLDGRVARLRIDGRRRVRFSPTFKVLGVTDRDVWVYADGREITDTCRDRAGELFFTIPGPVGDEILIEVVAGDLNVTGGL